MKPLNTILLLTASSLISVAQAQTTVKGKVTNQEGTELANITIKAHGLATKTDLSGNFELYIPQAGELSLDISAMGYLEQHIRIKQAGKITEISAIRLKNRHQEIQEVAVLGYNSVNNKSLAISKSGILDRDLPQAIQVINSEVIADQQINRLSDALKNANGIALGSNRGGSNENFFSRGYSLGSNNIFKNGSRTNNGGSIEASTLESVQILKGSAALLYGGVTGGAVVNMITKKPKFTYGAEVALRYGSYNQYKPLLDVYGPISKKLAFRLVGTGETSDSYRDYVESKRIYVNPSILYQISDRSSLNIMFDYLKSNYTPDFGIGTVDGKLNQEVGRGAFINTLWAFNNTNSKNTQADYQLKFAENWNLQVIANLQQYDRDYYGSERIAADALGIANRTLNKTEQAERTLNQQVNITGQMRTGQIEHQVLIGADADQSHVKNYAFNIFANADSKEPSTAYDKINVFNPYDGTLRSDMPTSTYKTRTSTNVQRYGVFIQDLISLTKQFKVLAGLRYTYFNTNRSNVFDYATQTSKVTENPGKDKVDMGDKIDKAWSPKIALIYQPLERTSIYVTYANNFTSNSGYDKAYVPMSPSTIDQYEAGIKNDFFQGRLSSNITVYRIQNNRFAQSIVGEDGKIADPNMKEFSGKTASDGVELDITGELAKGLNLLAGYSYNFMRYLETSSTGSIEDIRLVGTTAHTANGTLFYTLQSGKLAGLKLGVSTFYTGKRNAGWNNSKVNIAEGINRLITVDPFTTVDFSAGYRFKNWSILGKLSNIGNVFNYYIHENYSVNPIPPRSFTTTLSYKF